MADQSMTPGNVFADILRFGTPTALAWVRGGTQAPAISGLVKFYATPYAGVLIEAELFNLPNKSTPGSSGFYAMHIHETGNCSDDFIHTGEHFNPTGGLHPAHAGDMLPLQGNEGYSWVSFYDKRITIDQILGRSVIIHSQADDFTTQPAGNSGTKIACGVIRRA